MSALTDTPFFDSCREHLLATPHLVKAGRIRSSIGTVIEAEGLSPQVGAVCEITPRDGEDPLPAEVVGFREDRFMMMPLGESARVAAGDFVRETVNSFGAPAATACLGRVIDGLGRPIDRGPSIPLREDLALESKGDSALSRRRIDTPIDLGVRAINALLTTARGGRIGLFAGSGVGKSTLLGQIARFTNAEVIVVALIGERGREVREFVERELGDALERSIVVVATSDEVPLLRRRTAFLATALAEQLRAEGKHVLLLMDSATRFCTAQREIGLAAGEPPATRGFPPSLWSMLPRLLERAGTDSGPGSITGIYTVLVEGDDLDEPVADAMRALLDGHIVLSRKLAEKGQFPAIDVLASVSRLMPDVTTPEHRSLAARARQNIATHREAEDLLSIGAYVAGSDPAIDEACRLNTPLTQILCQSGETAASIDESIGALHNVLSPIPNHEVTR